MTTVEQYRPPKINSDAVSRPARTNTSTTTITRKIPPAVPSPPRQLSKTPPSKPGADDTLSPMKMAIKANQWLFTEAELASTPSVLDGIEPADERCRRAKGVNFIIQAGILLKLPQLTLATASVFFHRFYMRMSMVPEKGGLHHYNIAATALFLATKTEENCRKTKEIVIAVAKVAQKNSSLIIDEQSKEYWRWRDNILLYEELMLEYLTFDVVLQSPYTQLYKFIQTLHIEDNKPVRNLAWSFINDSCLTTLCLLMPPKDIAVAAVYFGLKMGETTIEDEDDGSPWWKQLGGIPERIIQAVAVMNHFYKENPLGKPDARSPTSTDEDLDGTRRRRDEASLEPGSMSPENRRNSQDSIAGPSQQETDAPPTNGHRTTEHSSSQVDSSATSLPTSQAALAPPIEGAPALNGLPSPISAVPAIKEPELISNQTAAISEPSGSSDVALKVAANDPATHELSGQTNGTAANVAAVAPHSLEPPPEINESSRTPKRKSLDDADVVGPASKKSKTENLLPVGAQEESEEGELEE